MTTRREIYVYADWYEFDQPMLIGLLRSEFIRGKELFSFEYTKEWLSNRESLLLDPELLPFAGHQFMRPDKLNFGLFLDSSPDRWGRLLMKRREILQAKEENRPAAALTETDYLLGVYDMTRMGGIRFKLAPDGAFLDDDAEYTAPPWASIRDLEYASLQLEKDDSIDDPEYRKWLKMLLEPGSSLGGARPKANVTDAEGALWIAKFPSGRDAKDMGAWEKVVNEMAVGCGLWVPESQALQFSSKQHTFLSKRFDRRADGRRIHFASAMTMLGQSDGADHNSGASYLDIASFITRSGADVKENLEQLFRRIVFNIAISNCDDHMRNHGFLLTSAGWVLSPVYDINPDENGVGLKLNISSDDNSLDYGVALSVAPHFRLSVEQAEAIVRQVKEAASGWDVIARNYGISRNERELMSTAFRY